MEEERFERIVKETMKGYPDFTFEICKSNKSSSKYLYIHDDLQFTKSLRVSDHRNSHLRHFDKEMVAPKIKEQVLENEIVKLCKSLKKKKETFLAHKNLCKKFARERREERQNAMILLGAVI